MSKPKDIHDEFLTRLIYDENSPSFLSYKIDIYDKLGRVHTRKGTFAGCIMTRKNNYRTWQVGIAEIGSVPCHRVVWALFNGKPDVTKSIDHIDGNALNNKITNLRLVTPLENNRNSARRIDFKDSYLPNGVIFRECLNGSKNALNPYFVVHWQVENKCLKKSFSINKLGIIKAQYEAIKFRKTKEINFSDRHGL